MSHGTNSNSQWGPGGRLALGKEWWVSDHWGIGVTAQLSLGSNRDSGAGSPTFFTLSPTLAFSATFN